MTSSREEVDRVGQVTSSQTFAILQSTTLSSLGLDLTCKSILTPNFTKITSQMVHWKLDFYI